MGYEGAMDESNYEMAMGTVAFEVEIMLASDSGREKHTDVEEQGAWLLSPIERGLRSFEPGSGVGFGRLRYMGEGRVGRSVVTEMDVGPTVGPFPQDEDRVKVAGLQGVISALSRTLMGVLDVLDDPDAVLRPLMASDHRVADALSIAVWSEGRGSLDEVAFQGWREALEWHP
jgi:hypothetical protein